MSTISSFVNILASCMFFQFPKPSLLFHTNQQFNFVSTTNIWVWFTNTFPVALTKKKAVVRERQESCCPEVSSEMKLSHTPIYTATALYFLYWMSQRSRSMSQLRHPVSTCATCAVQWKMWLFKVFGVICKFLSVYVHFRSL